MVRIVKSVFVGYGATNLHLTRAENSNRVGCQSSQSEAIAQASATEIDFRGLEPAVERNRESGERERRTGRFSRALLYYACVPWLAETQPGALKWAEPSGGVGIAPTVVPVGTSNRPF